METTLYVAVDIGCLECGQSSDLLGLFDTKESAEAACEKAAKEQRKKWTGEHSFEVFEWNGVNHG